MEPRSRQVARQTILALSERAAATSLESGEWTSAEWLAGEDAVWQLGEKARQLFVAHPTLRKDAQLQESVLAVATRRSHRRGRQAWITLLAYRAYAAMGPRVASSLDDPEVAGQVIKALYGMRAPGHDSAVRPHLGHPNGWVRREAKRYLAWSHRLTSGSS